MRMDWIRTQSKKLVLVSTTTVIDVTLQRELAPMLYGILEEEFDRDGGSIRRP
jgi:hypothetical protein